MNSFLKRFILRQEKNFFKEAKRYFFSDGVLFVVKEKQTGVLQQANSFWRFTVLVPKKTAKKASQRNTLKRVAREALREVLNRKLQKNDSTDIKYTISIVLFLKKQISYETLIQELSKIIEKL